MKLDITGRPMPTVKELMEWYSELEPHLLDGMGVFGELPLSPTNVASQVDSYKIKGKYLYMYIS